MPTSTIIGDVLQLRQVKIAARTGAAAYGTVVPLYGTTTVEADARIISAIREGDGKRLAAFAAINGATIRISTADKQLNPLAKIVGQTYAQSGSTPNQIGKMQLFNKAMPYIGIVGGADDDNGLENAFHFFAPKAKVTSGQLRLFSLAGGENPTFATMDMEFELFPDEGYRIGSANEVQTLTISGSPTGGTYTLSFGPNETSNLAYNANAAAITAALEALANIGTGNVVVTGTGPYVITFGGTLANVKLPLIVGDGSGLTGGSTPDADVARTTTGSEGDDLIVTLFEDEQGTSPTLPPAL